MVGLIQRRKTGLNLRMSKHASCMNGKVLSSMHFHAQLMACFMLEMGQIMNQKRHNIFF